VEVQVAVPPLPPRLHVVNVPDLLLDMLTVPVGVIGVPEAVSATVVLHVVPIPARSVVGEQVIEVDVVRPTTVRAEEPVPPPIQRLLARV
jgi:hypothetical protein